MKTKTFDVPAGMLNPFFSLIDKTMLQAELVEVNDDQELVVNVGYTEDDKEDMMDLIDLYEFLSGEQEEESEEEDDDEEEEEDDDLGCLEQEEPEVKRKRKTSRKK